MGVKEKAASRRLRLAWSFSAFAESAGMGQDVYNVGKALADLSGSDQSVKRVCKAGSNLGDLVKW